MNPLQLHWPMALRKKKSNETILFLYLGGGTFDVSGEKAEALKYIPKHADPREKPERERSVKARSILSSHTRIQGMALLPWALSMTHLQKMRILQLYPRNISASIREFRDLVAA
ncbi:uncharacterized protein [Henckelia pumila]|uniref:uncharacterized protein isoform X1 n=1 Tax=Henckelia pumila TaxID=405737 RepID=UPI003C6DD5D4